MRREDFVLKTDSHDRRFYMNIPKYEWEKKSSGVGDDDFSSRRQCEMLGIFIDFYSVYSAIKFMNKVTNYEIISMYLLQEIPNAQFEAQRNIYPN